MIHEQNFWLTRLGCASNKPYNHDLVLISQQHTDRCLATPLAAAVWTTLTCIILYWAYWAVIIVNNHREPNRCCQYVYEETLG